MLSLKCSEWLGLLECSWFYFPSEYTTAFSILWFCLNVIELSLKLQFNRLHSLTSILSIKMRTFWACGGVRTHPVHPPLVTGLILPPVQPFHSFPFTLLFLLLFAHLYLSKVLNILWQELFGDNLLIWILSNGLTVSTDQYTFFQQSLNLSSRLEVALLTVIGGGFTPREIIEMK